MGREPYAGSAATAFLYRLASVMGGPVCDKKRNRQKIGRKKKKTSSSLSFLLPFFATCTPTSSSSSSSGTYLCVLVLYRIGQNWICASRRWKSKTHDVQHDVDAIRGMQAPE